MAVATVVVVEAATAARAEAATAARAAATVAAEATAAVVAATAAAARAPGTKPWNGVAPSWVAPPSAAWTKPWGRSSALQQGLVRGCRTLEPQGAARYVAWDARNKQQLLAAVHPRQWKQAGGNKKWAAQHAEHGREVAPGCALRLAHKVR